MFWPRRLAALCRVGARRVRPCSSRAGTGAKRAASARRAPRYQWHPLIKLAGSSWVETASIRRLRVLRGCGSVSNYHSERANLFSTGAALRCERPGKKSRPDPPVHAFDAPSGKGRSRRSPKPRLRGGCRLNLRDSLWTLRWKWIRTTGSAANE